MNEIPGFIPLETISVSDNSVVYRATSPAYERPVIIKSLQKDYPNNSEIQGFNKQYEILKKLDGSGGVRALDLIYNESSPFMVLEEFEGNSLADYEIDNLAEGLKLALEIFSALADIHGANVIHKNISPANILYNKESHEVRFTGFSRAVELKQEKSISMDVYHYPGELAYVSPEQTGRMNRLLDYRTDYYSLGVLLYFLLTGRPPFMQTDPLELVHSHLARLPESPGEINVTIPAPVSKITLKLLAKNADERYQSIEGIVYDLEHCLAGLSDYKQIEDLEPGQADQNYRFVIPQKLYGRDAEVERLMNIYEGVSRGRAELMLVAGVSGVGKSALVRELQKPLTENRGYFASGKFEQLVQDIPYFAFLQIFRSLIKEFLKENEERLGYWKNRLDEALDLNAQVILDVIPELELILGPQPPVPILGPTETANRFMNLLQSLFNALTGPGHPLVIFLDDLQWADPASLKMMEKIFLNPSSSYLYVIGAYREEETDESHPLKIMIGEINGLRSVHRIYLTPLGVPDILELISDTLSREKHEAGELTHLVWEKTRGNPFFVNAFLKNLHEESLLYREEGAWLWDMSAIRERRVTDNVVELMAQKINQFPEGTRDILLRAACVGSEFTLEELSLISSRSELELADSLNGFLLEGLLFRTENSYRFAHDRIQEAAYKLLKQSSRIDYHYLIGKNTLEHSSPEDVERKIFFITNQYNKGLERLGSDGERLELARLNLRAGEKAKSSSAYNSAIGYLSTGIELLGNGAWTKEYELTFSLYFAYSESEYLGHNVRRAEKLFDLLLQKAANKLERCRVYEKIITLYVGTGRYEEALKSGLTALRLLGLSFGRNSGPGMVIWDFFRTLLIQRGRSINSLLYLPRISTDVARLTVNILMATGMSAYYLDTKLYARMCLRMVYRFIKFGYPESAVVGYIAYSGIIGSKLGFYRTAEKFSELSQKLIETSSDSLNNARGNFMRAFYIHHWTHTARESIELLKQSHLECRRHGDMMFAGHSINVMTMYRLMLGDNIDEVINYAENHRTFMESIKDPFIWENFKENRQYYRALKGETFSFLNLSDEDYDEEVRYQVLQSGINQLNRFMYFVVKIRLLYLFEDNDSCLEHCRQAEALVGQNIALGSLHIAEFYFYYALALHREADRCGPMKGAILARKARRIRKKFKRWSRYNPQDFLHKYLILKTTGRPGRLSLGRALKHFDLAASHARHSDYLQDEGIVSQMALEFCLGKKMSNLAGIYLNKALYAFQRWGAEAKVKYLQEKYQGLAAFVAMDWNQASISGADSMDLSGLLKGAYAISGEIILENLLARMMTILIENAGAESGVFVTDRKGRLFVSAEVHRGGEEINVPENLPLEKNPNFPEPLIAYVQRTGETLVLDDACHSGLFKGDQYIQRKKCRSIICLPVKFQGKLSGILYLENSASPGVFTMERLGILNVLTSQIAISLENAGLYGNLEEQVAARTLELKETLGKLQTSFDEIKTLKQRQDGDYFLTSLLIKPLGYNLVESSTVKVDSLTRQKKTFRYQKWDSEIGGDLCIASPLQFKDEGYILFLNVDAMGKSMQGAGGVLVLGSLFKNILERRGSEESRSVQEWLADTFQELGQFFEGFEGSMLLSLVLGLVNEQSGAVSLINAEHPRSVLYRDHKAEFLSNEKINSKIGQPVHPDGALITELSLKPGEALLLGSDGRDDVMLMDANTGNKEINFDENLFLRMVEQGRGDLEEIHKAIQAKGEIMDDVSFLKISYLGLEAIKL